MTTVLRAVDAVTVPLADAIDGYLSTLNTPEQARTMREYGFTLRRLARDLGRHRDVGTITQDDLAAWMQRRHGRNAAATWNRARNVLRAAWAHWAAQGWVQGREGPSWPVRPRKQHQEWSRAIPGDALRELLTDPALPQRERCLWLMLYDTGARISEILSLDVQDVDLAGRRASVLGKGSRRRDIVMTTVTASQVAAMLAGRTTGPLFAGLRGRLSVRMAQHLLAEQTRHLPGGPYSPHQLRHRRGSDTSAEGASQPMLMARGGWTDVRSADRYSRVDADALREWADEHWPPPWLAGHEIPTGEAT